MSVERKRDFGYTVLTYVSQDARGSDDSEFKSWAVDGLSFEDLELVHR